MRQWTSLFWILPATHRALVRRCAEQPPSVPRAGWSPGLLSKVTQLSFVAASVWIWLSGCSSPFQQMWFLASAELNFRHLLCFSLRIHRTWEDPPETRAEIHVHPRSSSKDVNETINIQDLEVDPHSWTDLEAKLRENMKRSCFKRARFDVYSERIAFPG